MTVDVWLRRDVINRRCIIAGDEAGVSLFIGKARVHDSRGAKRLRQIDRLGSIELADS